MSGEFGLIIDITKMQKRIMKNQKERKINLKKNVTQINEVLIHVKIVCFSHTLRLKIDDVENIHISWPDKKRPKILLNGTDRWIYNNCTINQDRIHGRRRGSKSLMHF